MSERARIPRLHAPPELLVFAPALAVRMALVVRSGGVLGNYGYDSDVYYASADALIHGRLPYRDFVLLHPRRPTARSVVLLALGQLGILIAAPSWFGFYADFAAVPVSLSLAAARRRPPATGAPGRVDSGDRRRDDDVDGLDPGQLPCDRLLARSRAPHRSRRRPALCHVDAPNGLIELNALDRNLANGCPNWVDVTGRAYFGADRAQLPRRLNARWQHDLATYLRSGDAVFLVRKAGDGMTAATPRTVEQGGVLAARGDYRVYRGGHSGRGSAPIGLALEPRSH